MTLHFKNVLISKSVSHSKLKKPPCVHKKNTRTKLRSPSKEEPARDLSIQSSFRDNQILQTTSPILRNNPQQMTKSHEKAGRCGVDYSRVQLIATGGGKNAAWMAIKGLIITATA